MSTGTDGVGPYYNLNFFIYLHDSLDTVLLSLDIAVTFPLFSSMFVFFVVFHVLFSVVWHGTCPEERGQMVLHATLMITFDI